MRGVLLESIEDFLRGRAQNVVDFVYLVEFIVAGEEWKQGKDLEKDTAHAPNIHLVPVVPISHQTLRCAVPTRRDVLCQGRFAIEAPTAAEIRQLDRITGQQYVLAISNKLVQIVRCRNEWKDLRLNVSMKNSVPVHMFDGLKQLINVELDSRLR